MVFQVPSVILQRPFTDIWSVAVEEFLCEIAEEDFRRLLILTPVQICFYLGDPEICISLISVDSLPVVIRTPVDLAFVDLDSPHAGSNFSLLSHFTTPFNYIIKKARLSGLSRSVIFRQHP